MKWNWNLEATNLNKIQFRTKNLKSQKQPIFEASYDK